MNREPVLGDVPAQVVLAPVGERIHLYQVSRSVPRHDGGIGTGFSIASLQPGHPCGTTSEGFVQRTHLPQMAALFGTRNAHGRFCFRAYNAEIQTEQATKVLHEHDGLWKVTTGVHEDHFHIGVHLDDQVDDGALLERTCERESIAKGLGCPGDDGFRRGALELDIERLELERIQRI